jgi:endonuclease/exonuclease/phosphatase family metal-dependent hydrolase
VFHRPFRPWSAAARPLRLPAVWAVAALCGACGALVPAGTRGETGEGEGETASTGVVTGADGPDLPPPDPADIVVATFNVRRFFDANCDSGQCGSGDYEEVVTETQFEYRAETLATAILALDADVVVLQEIENQDCLDALTGNLGGEYPTAVLGETGQVASVDVAVLSRHPSLEIRRHADVPLQRPSGGQTWFAREFLEVHLDGDGHRVVVFAAHFKAKNDDDPERRLAEATRARQIVDTVVTQHPSALIVLGGDLNDTPGSPPLAALEADGGMLRVAAELAPDDWTYEYNGRLDPIDHILMATESTGGRYLEGSARVFRGDSDKGYAGSDHAALRASFRAE